MQRSFEESLRTRLSFLRMTGFMTGCSLVFLCAMLVFLVVRSGNALVILPISLLILTEIYITAMRNIWQRKLARRFRSLIRTLIEESNVLIDIAQYTPGRDGNQESMEFGLIRNFSSSRKDEAMKIPITEYCRNWYQRIADTGTGEAQESIQLHRRVLNSILICLAIALLAYLTALPYFKLPWAMDYFSLVTFLLLYGWTIASEYRRVSNDLNNLFEEEVITYLLNELQFEEEEFEWADY